MLERFDRYMERCLYHPTNGFYSSGAGSAGRRGDFITSPEVGPLFADVLANALDHWWDDLGQPATLPVYDAGTGPGALVRSLTAAPGRSAGARTVSGADRRADGSTDLPADLTGSVVIANELLDNLPFRIAERVDGGWSEVWVRTDDAGARPVEVLEPLVDDASAVLRLPEIDMLAVGARVPVLEEASRWIVDVLDRNPAVLLVFDYGSASTADLGERGGWLRTYRDHQRSDDPYEQPGGRDITTDIAIDQLPTPGEVTDQGSFLRRWGIEQLVDEGREYWRRHAGAPDLAALKMRSRIGEAEALLDPAGLGGWFVCSWMSSAAV
ncbi:MAG: SAM-dependent methyltransferase [Acidimicrobiales bacterium]